MMPVQAVIIGVCGATALIGFWAVLRRRRQLPAALEGRPEMAVSDLYRQFYAELGVPPERFESWWGAIAKAFEVPAGRIRPADRFGVDLPFRPVLGMNDEDLFLFRELERSVGRKAAKEALLKLETVDQFIRFIAVTSRAA